MVTVQHRKSISCSLIYFFLYIFFFMSPRVKRFGSIWRLGDIFSAVCVAAQDIDLLSIYFLFLSLFCARKNAALPIAGRFSLRLWAANWIADSLLSLIIAPHINTHNPFFHKLWCWPPNFSFFFFSGQYCVTFCGCDMLHLVQPIHIPFSPLDPSAHTNASANFYCAAWLSLSIKKK